MVSQDSLCQNTTLSAPRAGGPTCSPSSPFCYIYMLSPFLQLWGSSDYSVREVNPLKCTQTHVLPYCEMTARDDLKQTAAAGESFSFDLNTYPHFNTPVPEEISKHLLSLYAAHSFDLLAINLLHSW